MKQDEMRDHNKGGQEEHKLNEYLTDTKAKSSFWYLYELLTYVCILTKDYVPGLHYDDCYCAPECE